jgi:hypothetical protein
VSSAAARTFPDILIDRYRLVPDAAVLRAARALIRDAM